MESLKQNEKRLMLNPMWYALRLFCMLVVYPLSIRHICCRLPFVYQSNGNITIFKDLRDENSEYVELNRIHTPKEIVKMLGITDEFAGLPTLKKRGLRDCQFEAISELESSFCTGQNRALMVLATGAGKTYTACMAAYRMLSYTPMRRILFLVDRNNLGKQAEGEFGMFRLTENGEPFNTIFTVSRLKSGKIPEDANVVISTIQRLFSLLKGDDITDSDDDENYGNDEMADIALPANLTLPPDYFDMITLMSVIALSMVVGEKCSIISIRQKWSV